MGGSSSRGAMRQWIRRERARKVPARIDARVSSSQGDTRASARIVSFRIDDGGDAAVEHHDRCIDVGRSRAAGSIAGTNRR